MLGMFTSPGRRKAFRRAEEGRNAYVDLPGQQAVLWAMLVVTFSAIDALLTLLHIQAGGRELIPTMRLALDFGGSVFVITKMAVTAAGVIILILHRNFSIARRAFLPILFAYVFLMLYHLILVTLR
jgi:hypothetical protein